MSGMPGPSAATDHGPAGAGRVPMLEFRGVTKAFGELEVLHGIDLQIAEHEAVAIIGASGSGKSTLLRCVDLLEDIDDGDIFLDGEVITDPSVDPVVVRRRLGLVFQAYNLFPHLTALENVLLGMDRAHRAERGEAERAARALLERFGLGGREDFSSDLIGTVEHPDADRVAGDIFAGLPDLLGVPIDAARRGEDGQQQSCHDHQDDATADEGPGPKPDGIHADPPELPAGTALHTNVRLTVH